MNNKTWVVWFCLVVALGLSVPAFASVRTDLSYSVPIPIEKMKPNGEFLVYLVEGNQWKSVGSLTFDRFFREREIALDFASDGDTNAKIALVQMGGGAAHIDSVFLGNSTPSDGFGTKEYEKIRHTDLDVVDAYRKTFILAFPADADPKILRLTARIEGEVPIGVPFLFPRENRLKQIDMEAAFYTYRIQSGASTLPSSSLPFFNAFCRPVTGHPDGFTYGWVWNDEENLYVNIDFTGDNTMDGTKDFAKVYVKSNGEIKEFKVSEDENRWGNSEFIYTDKVSWQHKVYHFQIPLEETRGTDEVLLLAFAAYGTAAEGGAIGDFVWHDFNGNGIQDAGEPGVDGVNVDLTDGIGNVLDTSVTAGGGLYQFSDLGEGNYKLHFFSPAEFTISPQNQGADDSIDSDADPITGYTALVPLAFGENNDTVDAGIYRPVYFGDLVWEDLNGDGIQDPVEPGMPGVTVDLIKGCPGSVIASMGTDANGNYLFDNLLPGDYQIRFVLPSGYYFSPQDQGTSDSLDSDADTSTGMTKCYTLGSGGSNPTVDAGMYQPLGACCDGETCSEVIGDACKAVWLGPDTTCSPDNPCIQGACCVAINPAAPPAGAVAETNGIHMCRDDVIKSECTIGQWNPTLTCEPYPCDPEPGACIVDGKCENVSRIECLGEWNEGRCPEAVPTVSEWGIIALSFLLIGSAAWFIIRRKQKA